MKTRFIASLTAGCALIAPLPLMAQSYQGRGSQEQTGSAQEPEGQTAPTGRRLSVEPYIEASQILTAQLSPFDDVLTYTQVAAGVDASYIGRNSGASVSLRYEHNFGYGDASDSDTVSGIARGYTTLVPQVLTLEAGALASRTTVTSGGANVFAGQNNLDNSSQTYSAYIGPNLSAEIDRVDITGNYRLGYTRVDSPDFVAPGGSPADVFDESVTHSAQLRAGTQPGEYLPVGIGVGGGYFREDIDNLDQRVIDSYLRADVTVPITPALAVIAGVGYEDVEVSSRDALRDAAGNPVIGPDGRLVTDESGPRRIAFEADGLIWDVGVLWRPSQRTSLQAVYGRRYDSDTYYGNFSWRPSRNSTLGVNVYDTLSGFGGRLTNSLAALPTDFEVVRDPISGAIVGCVNSVSGASCLDGLLGSVRSSVFRSRGVSAYYSRQVGRTTAGITAGYDRRTYLGAPGTVLEASDGVSDESLYIAGTVTGPLGRDAGYTIATYASYIDSGFVGVGDALALGSSAAYNRSFTRNLTGRVAVAVNYLDSEVSAEDLKSASALVGLRYGF
ncbi:MAG: preprotein translocase subunit YajC [Alphaproteobacteria bacterium]|jgi:hypothetical protein|nr:preprotein translocase subunit YajC [Alphaproteobacteria bacterium]MBU1607173.1 preprotein translocase subunit YajC [Alphaproteobacteria bacterium]